jgi:hypothetical protein
MTEPKHYVTTAELEAKLDKLPTKYEVRFLIVAAMVAAQLIPVNEAAQAALNLFK